MKLKRLAIVVCVVSWLCWFTNFLIQIKFESVDVWYVSLAFALAFTILGVLLLLVIGVCLYYLFEWLRGK